MDFGKIDVDGRRDCPKIRPLGIGRRSDDYFLVTTRGEKAAPELPEPPFHCEEGECLWLAPCEASLMHNCQDLVNGRQPRIRTDRRGVDAIPAAT